MVSKPGYTSEQKPNFAISLTHFQNQTHGNSKARRNQNRNSIVEV